MRATLPQHMSQAQMLATSHAQPLVNHGRRWEVFLGSLSLGFSDAQSERDAIIDAHRGRVINALYAHDGDAPAWLLEQAQSELPTLEVAREYPELLARFPRAAAKLEGVQ